MTRPVVPSEKPPRETIEASGGVAILASLFTVGLSVARAKITASWLGPTGLGRSSLALQWAQLGLVPMGALLGPPLIAKLASAEPADRQGHYDGAWSAALATGTVLAVLTVVVCLVVEPALAGLVGVGCIATLLDLMLRIPTTSSMALGSPRAFSFATAVFAASTVGCAAVGTILRGLDGQFLGMVVGPLLAAALVWPVWKRSLGGIRVIPNWAPIVPYLRGAFLVGATTILASAALQGALLAARSTIAREGGDEANGQFQAAWGVGAAYFGVVLQGLSAVVFPRFAAAANTDELQREVDDALRFVMKNAPPIILVAIGAREFAMRSLYSSEFTLAAEMVGFQMAGDIAKAVGWVHAGPLIYRGHARAFLVTELVGAAVLAASTITLVTIFGVRGASFGYLVTYVLYAPLARFVLARTLGVRTPSRTLLVGAGLTAAFGLLAWFSFGRLWLECVMVLVGTIWLTRTPLARLTAGRFMKGIRR